ncbi:MAG: bifunctional 3-phenylpropionate/cinnamic acid dioxygenase ferredoxin subunit [Acidocella sp.]|nr:bifunctional 3-phenylpropionate/cinnamic acid dioxygenase ferredoxin subunit [Acidocella sp.]
MEKVFVCAVAELLPGEALRVETDPAIAVFNANGVFYALADRCTHGAASMADGYIEEDCTVECPIHSAKFCLKTGRALTQPATIDLAKFDIKVEDGNVYVLAPARRAA